jgi:hypothetical protein
MSPETNKQTNSSYVLKKTSSVLYLGFASVRAKDVFL